jgi:phosphoenolpyruvate synthase/pyruvate phosphate dikinase
VDALLELEEAGVDGGGKARGLARLAMLGLPTPPALVLPAAAYARWRGTGRLPDDALENAFERLGGGPLAVRSSAIDEDTAGRSAAGQYESVMGVSSLADLRTAVETCYRAAESERARAYRGGVDAVLALVLQREVPADRAGVAFSRDPVTRDDTVLLEVVFGHGEQLVSGEAEPDRFWVPRDAGAVRARIADKANVAPARRFARTLRDDEARTVAALVLEAERGFDAAVDVELCFDGPRVWLVQCRPITTLG